MSGSGCRRFCQGTQYDRVRGLYTIGLMTLVLLAGCGSEQPASMKMAPGNPAVSDEECREFAQSIEKMVAEKNGAGLNQAIWWDAVVQRSVDSLGLSPKLLASFRKGFDGEIAAGRGIGGEVVKTVNPNGSYRFLRITERDGQKAVLFRLDSDNGINYHEWMLTKDDGKVKASDLFLYMTAERISDTMRRSVLPLAQEASKSFLEKLTESESEYMQHLDDISKITQAFQQQRFDDALRGYARLPASVKGDKNLLMVRYQSAASSGNEQEIVKAAEDFRTHHPGDVCLDLLLIDYYMLKKQPDKVLECIDRLDKVVGGDPYLNMMRANATYQENKNGPRAIEFAEKAMEGSPDMQGGYWALVNIALAEKDYDRALATLEKLDERFELEWGDLSTIAEFADFAASPQGQKWAKDHLPGSRSKHREPMQN